MRGYSTLVTVILLLAFISIIMVGINALSIGSLKSGFESTTGNYRLQESESCIEEVLRRLKDTPGFSGGTIPLSATASCDVSISGTDTQKTITGTVSAQNMQRSVTVVLSITVDGTARNFRILSWQEQ